MTRILKTIIRPSQLEIAKLGAFVQNRIFDF